MLEEQKQSSEIPPTTEETFPSGIRLGLELTDLLGKCYTAQGFLVFTAILGDKLDDKGNRVIEFEYHRKNLSFDDSEKAIAEFKAALIKDMRDAVDAI